MTKRLVSADAPIKRARSESVEAIDDAPRWSPVFRWWVQAPPGGWPKVPPGFLDAPVEVGAEAEAVAVAVEAVAVEAVAEGLFVEELMQASPEVFAAFLASLEA